MKISLSHPTIEALVEVITGGGGYTDTPAIGLYRTGPKLETFMRACGVQMAMAGRSRCPTVRETLLELVDKRDDRALRTIIERSADPRDFAHEPEKLSAVIGYLNGCLPLDGLELKRQGTAVRLFTANSSASVLESLATATDALDLDTVRLNLDRARDSADADPEDAITAACSVVESVCRSILSELGLPHPDRKDIQNLFKAVQEPLGLSPGRADLPTEIGTDVKMILQGLASMIQGIGALRTDVASEEGSRDYSAMNSIGTRPRRVDQGQVFG